MSAASWGTSLSTFCSLQQHKQVHLLALPSWAALLPLWRLYEHRSKYCYWLGATSNLCAASNPPALPHKPWADPARQPVPCDTRANTRGCGTTRATVLCWLSTALGTDPPATALAVDWAKLLRLRRQAAPLLGRAVEKAGGWELGGRT